MGITIEDGKGKGFSAEVNKLGHLRTHATSISRISVVSDLDGQAYTWSSRYLVAAGSALIFIKNTSATQDLIIDDIDVGGATIGEWELWSSTSTGAGVVISGTNLNRNSSNLAAASVFGNENITSNGSESIIAYLKTEASSTEHFGVQDSLILGQNDAIMVKKQLTPANVVSGICTVTGYFE